MNLEMRWLPVVKDEGNDDTYGPAVRDLQDAKDWCKEYGGELEQADLEWTCDSYVRETLPWGANGEYYDFEILPMEVEV